MAANVTVGGGSGNPRLTEAVAESLGLRPARCAITRFPDSELHVEIEDTVRGNDVYLIQPTSPPVDSHLMELLFLADAARRAGAARLTAVIPYFGYARQDRRSIGREAVAARLTADLLATSRIERIVAVDLHNPALEGFFTIPLDHLSAAGLLSNPVAGQIGAKAAVIAPDLGAVKLAERYGALLHLPLAIVHKLRLGGAEVRVRGIVGDVKGCQPVIVDDMITTGSTIEAACRALIDAGASPPITVIASHALLVGSAISRLSALPLRQIVVTDSVPSSGAAGLPLRVVSLAPLLAEVISRLNLGQSVNDLIVHR